MNTNYTLKLSIRTLKVCLVGEEILKLLECKILTVEKSSAITLTFSFKAGIVNTNKSYEENKAIPKPIELHNYDKDAMRYL